MILQIGTAQSLPFQGRWLGEAETERSSRICDNLSVRLADSIPTPFVPSGHFPLIGGIGPCKGSLWGAFCRGGALLRPYRVQSK